MSASQMSDQTQAVRLQLLRGKMREDGLYGLIIPRYDAHMAEYVAPCDQRLGWATGFTGSAGVAIITLDEAVLFIDGRYKVQARQQCPAELFSFRHLHQEPPADWLKRLAQSNKLFGFDPLHVPLGWYEAWMEAVKESGNTLAATDSNMIDALWDDRPAASKAQARPFAATLCGEGSLVKRQRIAAGLRDKQISRLVENQPDNIAWLLNIRGDDIAFNPFVNSFLTLGQDAQAIWYVARDKVPQDLAGFELEGVAIRPPACFLDDIAQAAKKGETFSIDPVMGAVAVWFAIADDAQITRQSSPITLEKARKNEVELQGMRDCHKQDALAWLGFAHWLDETVTPRAESGQPVTELETAAKIETLRRTLHGYQQPSFDAITGAGPNGAMCHYKATKESNCALDPAQIYLHDSGGQFQNGTTDATRTYSFAQQDQDFCTIYTAVLRGFIALARLEFPAKTCGHHIDAIARAPLWALGKDYDHGTGHGVGHNLSVHEQPQRIGRAVNAVELTAGMVVSIEPGHYLADDYGIRIENLFEIVSRPSGFLGFDTLTLIPINTGPILVGDLTDPELDWLNSYHKKVFDGLTETVPAHLRDYLTSVTKPLIRTAT